MVPGTFLAESSRCQTQDSKLSRFREEYLSVKMKQVSELHQRNSGSILQWPTTEEPEIKFNNRRGTVGVNLQSIKMAPLRMPN